MNTSIIKNGIKFLLEDFNKLKPNAFFKKYIIENQEVSTAVSQILVDLNNTDGGGPKAILTNVKATFINDQKSGKLAINYKLKLEWGCSAIKKELIKTELFEYKIDREKLLIYIFLFISN